MTIEQAVTKAIVEGWNSSECFVVGKIGFNHERAFLDLSFWQSLGKALDWDMTTFNLPRNNSWLEHWHHFIEHLAEGRSAADFFAGLDASTPAAPATRA
jgi:hypothetical protein